MRILSLVFGLIALMNTESIATVISERPPLLVISHTIYAEARGEGDYGMCLVASVIYNRSAERNLSAKEVCLQRKQFSCWNGHYCLPLIKTEKQKAAFRMCTILAKDIIEGKFVPFTDANHYYNPYKCSPSWGKQLKRSFIYKNHRFGYL